MASRSVIGVDVDPSFISVAEVRVNGGVSVVRAASAPLAPGVVNNGEVANRDELAAALKQLFRDHDLPKQVRLGVASPRIVVRMLDLPPLKSDAELVTAARFQAQEHLPMQLDEAVVEVQRLNEVETEEGTRTRTLVVAARKAMVADLLGVARQAGLRPRGIDLSAFALVRALVARPANPAECVLYVNAGGLTNLAVAEDTRCLFTRVLSSGVEGMAISLATRCEMTLAHSHAWLAHVGLRDPLPQIEGDPQIVNEARTVLLEGVRAIAGDIRNSLEFFAMQAGARSVDRIVISGPGASIPGFDDELATLLGLPVATGTIPEARAGAFGGVDGARYAVAAGLALTEAPS